MPLSVPHRVDQGDLVVVVQVEDQGQDQAQPQDQGVVEPGDFPAFHLDHRLVFEALVPLHQPLGQAVNNVPGQLGVLVQDRVELLLADGQQPALLHGLHRSRAGLAGDDGHFAEVGTRSQHR